LIAFWINHFTKQHAIDVNDLKGYLHRQPFLSSLLISVSFIPFILQNPPLIFLDLVWAVVGIITSLLIISNNDIPGKVKSLWLVSSVVFFLIGATDVLIYSSLAERWITAVINMLCVFIGLYTYQLIKNYSFYNGYTAKILLSLFVLFGVSSLVYNLLGYFSLSKVLTMTGSYLIFAAIALILFTRISADLIKILFKVFQTQASTSFNAEIDSLLREFTILLKMFSFIMWVGIGLNNLNILDGLTANLSLFLNNPITVGKAVFTPWSIVIFFIIIWISALMSRIASILTEYGYNINRNAFSSLKNCKLLVKIGTITFGLILAFAASGISIDKLAIIISALSVGIGFGLQSLINNLVSGIIISIERPVRIGDSIEVMGFSGIVRDIGIPSSKIRTSNGPDIIIPNGEILSHALIKWTVNNGQRVMDISLIIKYKADLNNVYKVIKDVFKNSAGILKHPEPIIQIVSIQPTGINIKCYFWCAESGNWENEKSKVLTDCIMLLKKKVLIWNK
jgi:potassium efflux system protein